MSKRGHIARSACTALILFSASAHAAVSTTGDVSPNPATTTSADALFIGNIANGDLTVDNGSTILTGAAYLGNNAGVTGTATLTGPATAWNADGPVFVGYNGTGYLNLSAGATLHGSASIGHNEGASGFVTLDGPTTSWTDTSATGIVVGNRSVGFLSILNGATVNSQSATLGKFAESNGRVTVDGPNSTWNAGGTGITVATAGTDTVQILHGGTLHSTTASIGVPLSSGFITGGLIHVSGQGSRWIDDDGINMDGLSILRIVNGAAVSTELFKGNGGLLQMTVGDGSSLAAGQAMLAQLTRTTFYAAASATPGATYSPISASPGSTWSLTTAVGGTWNSFFHTFTVSLTATGNAGSPVLIDRSLRQRILITDPNSASKVLVSFSEATTPSRLTFTATPLDSAAMDDLQASLPPDHVVLTGWSFDAQDYEEPIYRSMFIGPNFSDTSLELWYYDGRWDSLGNHFLNYDNGYLSFSGGTLDGHSYAITTAIPEPASLAFLLLAAPLLARRRRV